MQNIDKKELLKKIKILGLKKGDAVYCHNNLSFFFLDEKSINKQKIVETFLKIIMQIIGNDGTLIVPTYTYSFSKFRNGVHFKKKVTNTLHKMDLFLRCCISLLETSFQD